MTSLVQRVAMRSLAADGYFSVGDEVRYGKYKTKRGKIIRIFDDERGVPSVEIEPIPQGRKQNKIIGLYKIWKTQEAQQKQACVVFSKKCDGDVVLGKVRDRMYDPEVCIYHLELDGTEMCVMFDRITGFCEGLNEHGIGVVNSALMVLQDEAEGAADGDNAPERSPDGVKILKALTKDNIPDVLRSLISYKPARFQRGLKGHTLVSDGTRVYALENTRIHTPKAIKLDPDEVHTRTNHGIYYPGAGYTKGDDYISSIVRQWEAKKQLEKANRSEDLMPALTQRIEKAPSALSPVRFTDKMRTTSQMVVDPANLEMLLYLVPEHSKFEGIRNLLPDGRKPKIKVRVFKYPSKKHLQDPYITVPDEMDSASAKRSLRRQVMALHVAARYKSKKKVKTKDGDEMTVYEYSDRQVAGRNRKKAERLELLRKSMKELRTKVRKDIRSKDEKTRDTALAVGLMDETFERIGNDSSAKEGHFGVTTWRVKHIKFRNGTATISYVGKSGVDQKKKIDTPQIVAALKEICKDKKDNDCALCVSATDVNKYLEPFGISAKDIRGFHANTEMKVQLRKVRKGKLPEDPKERKEKLKTEFNQALEATAEQVGHEPSTLKSQYLVPGLEEDYMNDGTINEQHTKKSAINLRMAAEQGTLTERRILSNALNAPVLVIQDRQWWLTEAPALYRMARGYERPRPCIEGLAFPSNMFSMLWYEDEEGNNLGSPDLSGPDFSGVSHPGNARYQVSRFPTVLHNTILQLNDDGTSTAVVQGESGYPSDLVTAMVRSNDWDASDAIMVAGQACERCLNVLLNHYDSQDGYKFGSEAYWKTGTRCSMCTNIDNSPEQQFKTGTKSKAEEEDDLVQKMLRKEPKLKPPRYDLRNNRTLDEEEEENLGGGDDGDRDLSMKWTKVAHRVAFCWLVAPRGISSARVALFHQAKDAEQDASAPAAYPQGWGRVGPGRGGRPGIESWAVPPGQQQPKQEKSEDKKGTFEEWVKDETFPHPETKNDVGFSSLPVEEQKKIREKWKASQGQGEEEEGDEKGDKKEEEEKERSREDIDADLESARNDVDDLKDSIEETQKKIKGGKSQIQTLKKSLEEEKKGLEAASGQERVRKLQAIQDLHQKIKETKKKVRESEDELEEHQDDLKAATAQVKELKAERKDPSGAKRQHAEKAKKERARRVKESIEKTTTAMQTLLGKSSTMAKELRAQIESQIIDFNEDEMEEFALGFEEQLKKLTEKDPASDDLISLANQMAKGGFTTEGLSSPQDLAERLAQISFVRNVVANPMIVGGTPVGQTKMDTAQYSKRAIESFQQYHRLDKTLRTHAAAQIAKAMKGLDPDSDQAQELQAILTGMNTAHIADTGDSLPGQPQPSHGSAALVRKMVESGNAEMMLRPVEDMFAPDSRQAMRQALNNMDEEELVDFIVGQDPDHPFQNLAEHLQDGGVVGSEYRQLIKKFLIDDWMNDIWGDRAARDVMEAAGAEDWDDPQARAEVLSGAKANGGPGRQEAFQALGRIQEARKRGAPPDPEDEKLVQEVFWEGGAHREHAKNLLTTLQGISKEQWAVTPATAVLKHFVETGDQSVLETETLPHADENAPEHRSKEDRETARLEREKAEENKAHAERAKPSYTPKQIQRAQGRLKAMRQKLKSQQAKVAPELRQKYEDQISRVEKQLQDIESGQPGSLENVGERRPPRKLEKKHEKVRDMTDEEIDSEAGEYFENDFTQAALPNAFKDKEDLKRRVKEAEVTHLDADQLAEIANSDVGDVLRAEDPSARAKELAKEYGRDLGRVERGIADGEEMPPAIVLRDKNGKLVLMGGNTRLMGGAAAGTSMPVKIIDVDSEYDEGAGQAAAQEDEKHGPGDVWETEAGNWRAKNPKGAPKTFDDKAKAEQYAKAKERSEAPKKKPEKSEDEFSADFDIPVEERGPTKYASDKIAELWFARIRAIHPDDPARPRVILKVA